MVRPLYTALLRSVRYNTGDRDLDLRHLQRDMTAKERRTTENPYAWSTALHNHRRLYELIALRPMTHLEERNYIRCVFASQLTQAELRTLLNLAGPYPTGFGQLQRGI